MGNFLSDVGRSTLSGSVRDLIQSKIALDANARADESMGMQRGINAEQMKILQRQSAAVDEKTRHENTPIPINSISHMVEFGEQGPIFKHLFEVADSMGLVDKSIPGNPTILRKHLNQDVQGYMQANAQKLNLMRIDAYNQQIVATKQILAEKPNDKNAQAALEKAITGLQQATMQDAGLRELTKQEAAYEKEEMRQREIDRRAKESNARMLQAAQIAAGPRYAAVEAGKEKETESKNDPNYKMTKDEKWATEYLKTYKESSTPSPIMAMLAANDPNSPAAKALAQQQNQALSSEVKAKLAKANAIVDRMIAKNEPKEADTLPPGLTEETIEYNMKTYNKTREEVIAQFNKRTKR